MSFFTNPRTAPAWTAFGIVTVIGAGAALSATRLQTVAAEQNNNAIASYRADICRILPTTETVELGAYYFQPTATLGAVPHGDPPLTVSLTGSLLTEGMYICDWFGKSARIERGGYAQFVVVATDIAGVNKTLTERLSQTTNPDNSRLSQVRRAWNMGVYVERPTNAPNQFFNPNPGVQ